MVRPGPVKRSILLIPLGFASVFFAAPPAPAQRAGISITAAVRVGPNRLTRATRPEAPAVNDLGDVVGRCYVIEEISPEEKLIGRPRPFFFDRSAGTVTNLGHPEDAEDEGFDIDSMALGYDVNNLGWVVGGPPAFVWRDADGNGRRDEGELLLLDTGDGSGVATHVNDAGRILLKSYDGNIVERIQVAWGAGGFEEIGDRVLISEGGYAHALAEDGSVSWNEDGQEHRWIDRNEDGVVDPEEVALLYSPFDGAEKAFGRSMNNLHQVLGITEIPNTTFDRGFVWTDLNENDIQDEGETVLVDTDQPGVNVHCWAINDRGEVTGGYAYGGVRWAFLWDEEHGIRNLNDLFTLEDPELGVFSARQGHGINNFGEVAVYGRFSQTGADEYAVLISPRPGIDGISQGEDAVILGISGLTRGIEPTVERAEDLVSGDWLPVDVVVPTSTSTNWIDSTAGLQRAFYRLRWDEGP